MKGSVLAVFGALMALGGGGIVATGAEGACPNQASRVEQRAEQLPDCRAVERVTPADQNGGDVFGSLEIAEDGEAASWVSTAAYAEPQGFDGHGPYAARRTSGGWVTSSFSPRFEGDLALPILPNLLYMSAFDRDLSHTVVQTRASLVPGDEDLQPFLLSLNDVYVLGPGGEATWVSRPTGPSPIDAEAFFQGISRDGSTIFFKAAGSFAPEAVQPEGAVNEFEQVTHLYRWKDGRLEVVDRGTNGKVLADGGALGGDFTSETLDNGAPADSNAVSADGDAYVYGSSPGNVFQSQLYLGRVGRAPLEITLSQRAGTVGEPAPEGAKFLAASEDFGRILFNSRSQLTEDAPSEGGAYIYDVATEELEFVAPGVGAFGSSQHNGYVVKESADGSKVYFISELALAAGAQEDELQLYVFAGGETRLVAPLSPGDLAIANSPLSEGNTTDYDAAWLSDPAGSRLAFVSSRSIGGADNAGFPALYLYDFGDGSIGCISCRPDGAASEGGVRLQASNSSGGSMTPRAIDARGRIYFSSTDDILAGQDTNGESDVYEFDPQTGLHLLTDGHAVGESYVYGVTSSGRDVFVRTRQPLLASDRDGGDFDLYDLRESGGFAEPPQPAACAGEGCQPPPTPPPSEATVATGFNGPGGNVKSPPHKKSAKHGKKSKPATKGKACAKHKHGGKQAQKKCTKHGNAHKTNRRAR